MNTPIKTKYYWVDFWTKQNRETPCEVIEDDPTKKRVKIKFLGYGPNNTPPGSASNVGREKLECYQQKTTTRDNWKNYTYFEK